jgi:hypothetical protein
MSHVVGIETEISDLAALRSACERLGFDLREGQKSYRWYGRFMGDYPMPEGMSQSDLGKCDHAIRVPGADYEVGVRQQPNGSYRLAYDFWQQGGLLGPLGGQKAEKLVQAYGAEKVKREVKRKGFRVKREVVMANGDIKVIVDYKR